jgi:nitrite reductase (NADH) small subunit
MKVRVGRLEMIPSDRCIAVGDGAAIVVRRGDDVVAFSNRCLHQDSPLEGGWVHGDELTCPLHFWRYSLADGALAGSARGDRLERLPTSFVDGEIVVEVHDPPPAMSLRDRLLARASAYDRAVAFRSADRSDGTDHRDGQVGAP